MAALKQHRHSSPRTKRPDPTAEMTDRKSPSSSKKKPTTTSDKTHKQGTRSNGRRKPTPTSSDDARKGSDSLASALSPPKNIQKARHSDRYQHQQNPLIRSSFTRKQGSQINKKTADLLYTTRPRPTAQESPQDKKAMKKERATQIKMLASRPFESKLGAIDHSEELFAGCGGDQEMYENPFLPSASPQRQENERELPMPSSLYTPPTSGVTRRRSSFSNDDSAADREARFSDLSRASATIRELLKDATNLGSWDDDENNDSSTNNEGTEVEEEALEGPPILQRTEMPSSLQGGSPSPASTSESPLARTNKSVQEKKDHKRAKSPKKERHVIQNPSSNQEDILNRLEQRTGQLKKQKSRSKLTRMRSPSPAGRQPKTQNTRTRNPSPVGRQPKTQNTTTPPRTRNPSPAGRQPKTQNTITPPRTRSPPKTQNTTTPPRTRNPSPVGRQPKTQNATTPPRTRNPSPAGRRPRTQNTTTPPRTRNPSPAVRQTRTQNTTTPPRTRSPHKTQNTRPMFQKASSTSNLLGKLRKQKSKNNLQKATSSRTIYDYNNGNNNNMPTRKKSPRRPLVPETNSETMDWDEFQDLLTMLKKSRGVQVKPPLDLAACSTSTSVLLAKKSSAVAAVTKKGTSPVRSRGPSHRVDEGALVLI